MIEAGEFLAASLVVTGTAIDLDESQVFTFRAVDVSEAVFINSDRILVGRGREAWVAAADSVAHSVWQWLDLL